MRRHISGHGTVGVRRSIRKYMTLGFVIEGGKEKPLGWFEISKDLLFTLRWRLDYISFDGGKEGNTPR